MRNLKVVVRRMAGLLALVICGIAFAPQTASASYCVWRVITTRVTIDGELAYETKEYKLLYCCGTDPRCEFRSA